MYINSLKIEYVNEQTVHCVSMNKKVISIHATEMVFTAALYAKSMNSEKSKAEEEYHREPSVE